MDRGGQYAQAGFVGPARREVYFDIVLWPRQELRPRQLVGEKIVASADCDGRAQRRQATRRPQRDAELRLEFESKAVKLYNEALA